MARKQKRAKAEPGSSGRGAKAEKAGPNPYDRSFQNKRRRHAVLNERVKGEQRNVAKSRVAATSERKQKLLQDQLTAGRSSKFRDARLGGDADDGAGVQRLVRLRQRQAKKSFNLGKLSTEDLHHGGQPLSSLPDSELRRSAESDEEDPGTTMDDIIEMGRARKEEAAREREELERQRGDLDKDFSSIMGELNFRPSKAQRPIDRAEPDTYDKLLKELVFDKKATATERTKTPEEIAREKAEKLEALERQRLARTDGLAEDVDEESEVMGASDREAEDDQEEEEGEEEEQEEDALEPEGDAQLGDALGADMEDKAKDGKDEDEDDRLGEDCIKLMRIDEAEKPYKHFMKNASGEEGLPFAPECPSDRLSVEKLLAGCSPTAALKLIQRVRTRTSAALGTENRRKLRSFFLALLDFSVNVVARSDGDISAVGMALVYGLQRPLLEMANEHPEAATNYFLELLKDLGDLPKARELAALKLVPWLFPVTDFQHPVVTPATILADHWASQLAALGENIQDLVSEATMLCTILYELLSPGQKFCSSFFQLGAALLESCAASAEQGRQQCADAAKDIAALLANALSSMEPAVKSMIMQTILQPRLGRLLGKKVISQALQILDEGGPLKPLQLFEEGAVQIKMLDPIFHEEGDRPRGMEASETKQLHRKLNQERRAAARQLSRDSAVVQQLQNQKAEVRRKTSLQEKKRVRQLMDTEKQELKKMATEFDKTMNTTFGSYSKTKERKKANRRMAGNATAENPKAPKPAKVAKGQAKKQKEGKS
ncbi:unnamed protein product [Effrenium voratum]|nr:unnamed protein product [Effrenium voratum]